MNKEQASFEIMKKKNQNEVVCFRIREVEVRT